MADILKQYGVLNEMSLALVREPLRASPGAPTTQLCLTLMQDDDERFIADFPDTPSGMASAASHATAILSAATIAGITVNVG